jgi:hypothetical protein
MLGHYRQAQTILGRPDFIRRPKMCKRSMLKYGHYKGIRGSLSIKYPKTGKD